MLTQAALARLFLSGDEPMPVTTAVHVPFGLALALYPAVLAVSLAGRSGHDG